MILDKETGKPFRDGCMNAVMSINEGLDLMTTLQHDWPLIDRYTLVPITGFD